MLKPQTWFYLNVIAWNTYVQNLKKEKKKPLQLPHHKFTEDKLRSALLLPMTLTDLPPCWACSDVTMMSQCAMCAREQKSGPSYGVKQCASGVMKPPPPTPPQPAALLPWQPSFYPYSCTSQIHTHTRARINTHSRNIPAHQPASCLICMLPNITNTR